MIKTFLKTSNHQRIVDDCEMEVVNVMAERNSLSSFKSETENYLLNFESNLSYFLNLKFKSPNYKILLTTNKNKKGKINILNFIVLLESKAQIDYVKESLTEKKIKFDILEEIPKKETITKFKIEVQNWANEIQRYLSNEFGFLGTTRIEASHYKTELQSFNITNSGKGLNDDIVWAMKEISKTITLSKDFAFYTDDKFSFINSYFKR